MTFPGAGPLPVPAAAERDGVPKPGRALLPALILHQMHDEADKQMLDGFSFNIKCYFLLPDNMYRVIPTIPFQQFFFQLYFQVGEIVKTGTCPKAQNLLTLTYLNKAIGPGAGKLFLRIDRRSSKITPRERRFEINRNTEQRQIITASTWYLSFS